MSDWSDDDCKHGQLKRVCELCEVEAERDRLREALEMIAIPPVHIPDLSEGCEGCAGVARAALDGTDYNGPISVTPAQAVTGTLGPTSPEYQALMQQAMDLADEGDRLRGAVEAAQSLVEALDSNPIGEYGDAVCEAIDALDGKLNAAKEGDVSNVDPDSVRRMISEGRARQLDRAVDQIEELTAEQDRLIGHLNEYARSCPAHVAERDRLQADHAHLLEVNAALRTRPDLAERAPLVVALVEERDLLRDRYRATWGLYVNYAAIAEAVRQWRAASPGHESAVAIQAVHDALDALDAKEEGGVSDCPHEATGSWRQTHCRDCGDVLFDGVWVERPEKALRAERDLLRSALLDILVVESLDSAHLLADGALNAVTSELDQAVEYANLRDERDRLRAVVEAAQRWKAAEPGHEASLAIQAMYEALAALDAKEGT